MKIGIIQTRGLGDIVIAAPIALYYINRGCEVYWPIDSEFIASFAEAFPKIKFIGINREETGNSTAEYFYYQPLKELTARSCTTTICLYSQLTGFDLGNQRIQASLAFDAYKYAVAKVPFQEKWNFYPHRNPVKEGKIFEILNLDPFDEYIVTHEIGSNFSINFDEHTKNLNKRIIQIEPLTNNIFDWIGVMENAHSLYLVDSVYANIAEQLKLKNIKNFYLRSNNAFTPTLITNWNFI